MLADAAVEFLAEYHLATLSTLGRRNRIHAVPVGFNTGSSTRSDRLVDAGKSVIVIEHHLAVVAHADWIVDLGPGAGHDGGRVVFEGTPADLVADPCTVTGEHLAAYVGA